MGMTYKFPYKEPLYIAVPAVLARFQFQGPVHGFRRWLEALILCFRNCRTMIFGLSPGEELIITIYTPAIPTRTWRLPIRTATSASFTPIRSPINRCST